MVLELVAIHMHSHTYTYIAAVSKDFSPKRSHCFNFISEVKYYKLFYLRFFLTLNIVLDLTWFVDTGNDEIFFGVIRMFDIPIFLWVMVCQGKGLKQFHDFFTFLKAKYKFIKMHLFKHS